MLGRFRVLYKLRIDADGVHVVVGRPPASFLAAVRDIAGLHGIDRGEIACRGRGRHMRLRFSDSFPARGRQAIRNMWSPPTTPGPGGGRRASG